MYMGKPHRYYTDYERLEFVKKWKVSKLNKAEFARQNDLAYETFRDWVRAYNNLEGRFVKIDPSTEGGYIGKKNDITMNLLNEEQVIKKSTHFSRFDHSIVVIEYKSLKITTSLAQALAILDRIND